MKPSQAMHRYPRPFATGSKQGAYARQPLLPHGTAHLTGKLNEAAYVGGGSGFAIAHVDHMRAVLQNGPQCTGQPHDGLHAAQARVPYLARYNLGACNLKIDCSTPVTAAQSASRVQGTVPGTVETLSETTSSEWLMC